MRFSDNDGKEYNYKQSDVQICKPEILSPDFCYVTYKGKQFSGLTGIYKYAEAGYWYLERGRRPLSAKEREFVGIAFCAGR